MSVAGITQECKLSQDPGSHFHLQIFRILVWRIMIVIHPVTVKNRAELLHPLPQNGLIFSNLGNPPTHSLPLINDFWVLLINPFPISCYQVDHQRPHCLIDPVVVEALLHYFHLRERFLVLEYDVYSGLS